MYMYIYRYVCPVLDEVRLGYTIIRYHVLSYPILHCNGSNSLSCVVIVSFCSISYLILQGTVRHCTILYYAMLYYAISYSILLY